MKTMELSRRQFLKGTGALIVSFNLFPPAADLFAQETVGPGIDADPTSLDSWLAIARDGTVTVFSGKVDLGTGVETALAQIVAEELDVPFKQIKMIELGHDEGDRPGYYGRQQNNRKRRTAIAASSRCRTPRTFKARRCTSQCPCGHINREGRCRERRPETQQRKSLTANSLAENNLTSRLPPPVPAGI